jgi:hypothetical protein
MITLNISNEKKKEFSFKFHALKTVDEKFDFWLEELKHPYSNFNLFNYQEVSDFDINAEGDEALRINELVINEAKIRERQFGKKTILDFDEFFYAFQEKLSKSKKPLFTIEKEIKSVDSKLQVNRNAMSATATSAYKRVLMKIFVSSFEDFYEKDIRPNLSSHAFSKEYLIVFNNGLVIAEYLLFLEKKHQQYKSPKSIPKIIERTLAEELLLLYYTKLLKHFDKMNNQNRNEFLGILLKKSPNKIDRVLYSINSIRYVDGVKTKENLENVITILDSLKLHSAVEEAKNEKSKLR